MQPDNELLRQYARAGSESAFTELVKRHVNLVYSAALRQAGGDAHLAHDVAQNVFTDLARKASSLCRRESLTGWLYTSAYFAAAKMVRTEIRRREREEKFMREPGQHDIAPDANWEKLRPILDAAMHGLKESEREAVLLRYFENCPYAEVGAKLGVNENAARMRVERALEKLRALLAQRGIATGTALATALSVNAVQNAPSPLSGNLASTSMSGAATGGLLQKLTAAKIKLCLVTIIVACGVAVFSMQQHSQKQLQTENETAMQELTALHNQNTELSNQLSEAIRTAGDPQDKLLKLRAEVIHLRAANTPAVTETEPATNTMADGPDFVIRLVAQIATAPAARLQTLSYGWTSAGAGASLLSSDQSERVSKILSGDGEIRLIRTTQMISGNNHAAETSFSYSRDGTNSIGVLLGSTPYFSSNSSAFTLSILTELSCLNSGVPSFQPLQISNQVCLIPGQSTVLEKDIPPGNWLRDALALSDDETKLLILVTPAIQASNVGWNIPFRHATPLRNFDFTGKIDDAKQAASALIRFASENRNEFPASLVQTTPYLQDDSADRIVNEFDFLIPSGSNDKMAAPATIILLREKEAWQDANGIFHKVYAFADGHAEIRFESTPSGPFE